MKIVATRQEWVRTLSFLLDACDRRAPGFSGAPVLLVSKGGSVEASAFDGLMAALAIMTPTISMAGSVGLAGPDLLERVRSMPDADVTLTVAKDGGASLTSGKRKHTLKTIAGGGADWRMPDDLGQPVTLPGDVLATVLSRVAYAQHESVEVKGHGTALRIAPPVVRAHASTFRGQATHAVSVDGLPDVAVTATISNRLAATLAKMASRAETITLQFSRAKMAVNVEHRTLVAPLMIDEPADFNDRLPPAVAKVQVGKLALLSALGGIECAARGKEGENPTVVLSATPKALSLVAINVDGDGATDEIEPVTSDKFTMRLPIKQLLAAVGHIESDEVQVSTADPARYPAVVEPVNQAQGGLQRHLVMPQGTPDHA